MQRISLVLLGILILNVQLNAQDNSLKSSIGYSKPLWKNSTANGIHVDVFSEYPEDLKTSSLFFINISEGDTYGNTGSMGPKYARINSDLISKMVDKYPFEIEFFSNEYQLKDKEFFTEKGFKYRLLIRSSFIKVQSSIQTNNHYHMILRQYFAVAIEDLETGTIYSSSKWREYCCYVKKFVKNID